MRIYREYEGGYARTHQVDAVLAAKKAGKLGKPELRLFFAELEREESGKHVTVDFILNGERPKRRMTSGQQDMARERLYLALTELKSERELSSKVPRKVARAAARGFLDTSVMIASLFYCKWRKPQRRKRKLVQRGERYASFTFEKAKEVTGLARGTLCKAFQFLRRMKVIAVAWRPMQQIKRFGMLFVDGEALNLYCKIRERYRGSNPYKRLQKTRTQPTKNENAINKTLPKNSLKASVNEKRGSRNAIAAFAAKFCPEHKLAKAC